QGGRGTLQLGSDTLMNHSTQHWVDLKRNQSEYCQRHLIGTHLVLTPPLLDGAPGEDHMLHRLLIAVAAAAALASVAAAQDLPATHFKVIGLNSPTPASIVDEVPFWRKTIPEASKGALTADITPLDQMGIDDKTMLRLLKLGVMDFAGMDISK